MQPAILKLNHWDIETLLTKLSDTTDALQRVDAAREENAKVQEAVMLVARAKKSLADAEATLADAERQYVERRALLVEEEQLLRADILNGWPDGEKTIGNATVATRTKLARSARPLTALYCLRQNLPEAVVEKVVVDLVLDEKALKPLLQNAAFSGLKDAFRLEETRVLQVRANKEEK